ncbi:MAG TPA: glycoside hydrolase family 2 TIM barrel-domain containing protein [Mucilaginibacter sp.]|nr:glycoside hydrolase family 2 TIM barrel-domain containing protein [Mucilaginibacter sp.]
MKRKLTGFILLLLLPVTYSYAQTAMANVYGRNTVSLNGQWEIIVDPYDSGIGKSIYKDVQPTGKTAFVEYSFDPSNTLCVPGDFNSQRPELTYFESSVWYKKTFNCDRSNGERLFIYFGAVNYIADVYLNGKKLGHHEGGFTPFQFEVTGLVKPADNDLIVRVNSRRARNGIPGSLFDWFNYGGITRDVLLVHTWKLFIDDYKLQLDARDGDLISGYVQLDSALSGKQVNIVIPGLKINEKLTTDSHGHATLRLKRSPQLWSPENPKLYAVSLSVDGDTINDKIGFRSIKVEGTKLLLNGKPVFLRGVNIHEEIPQQRRRAYSDSDAMQLIDEAKELGCNFVRLVHYPHNEYTIRYAEEKGVMIWEEIPVWQDIDFKDTSVKAKASLMLREVIKRDQNRCNVIFWSIANETRPSKERDETLVKLAAEAKQLDATRLVTAAFDDVSRKGNRIALKDTVMKYLDVIGINEYLGWYIPWPAPPGNMDWTSDFNKPVVISEFGGESVYDNTIDTAVKASAWSEEYVAGIYRDQITMFGRIPFLQGVCPWVLADFRSPFRMQSTYQKGWNRKGLLSDRGEKKKAWYIM